MPGGAPFIGGPPKGTTKNPSPTGAPGAGVAKGFAAKPPNPGSVALGIPGMPGVIPASFAANDVLNPQQLFPGQLPGSGGGGGGGMWVGGSADPRPGLIAAAQAAANKTIKQVTDLYGALAANLHQGTLAGDKSYAGSEADVNRTYGNAQSAVGSNYANSRASIDAELNRLGQQNSLGAIHASQAGDENFLHGILGSLLAGTHGSQELLKQGEHGFNEAQVHMATTEGANRKADLLTQLQQMIAKIQSGPGGSKGHFVSGGSGKGRGSSSKPPGGVLGLAQEVGGTLGPALGQLFSNYIGSETAQHGKQYEDFHTKDANGKEVFGWVNNNAAQTAADLTNAAKNKYKNSKDQATLSKLAQLASQLYYNKTGYQGKP